MKLTKLDNNQWVIAPKTVANHRKVGRNSNGRITAYHRGNGHSRKYRPLQWYSTLGRVCLALRYDPNRSANIAIIQPLLNQNRYWILAPKDIAIGSLILYGNYCFQSQKIILDRFKTKPIVFNRHKVKYFTIGTKIHSIARHKTMPAKIALAGGRFVTILAANSNKTIVLLPSGKKLLIPNNFYATSGIVSTSLKPKLYKAGQNRWRGIRPKVRGVAINPIDHPHGGRTSGGRPCVRPWGKYTKGFKTVKRNLIY